MCIYVYIYIYIYIHTYAFDSPCKTRRFRAQKRQTTWSEELPRISSSDLGVFVSAKRATVANEAEDSSVVKGNAVTSIKEAPSPPSGLHGSVDDGRSRRRSAASDNRRAGSRRVPVTCRRVCAERACTCLRLFRRVGQSGKEQRTWTALRRRFAY